MVVKTIYIFFLQFVLLTLVESEWVEITKVGRTNTKTADKNILAYTLPSSENTLEKPRNIYKTVRHEEEAPIAQLSIGKIDGSHTRKAVDYGNRESKVTSEVRNNEEFQKNETEHRNNAIDDTEDYDRDYIENYDEYDEEFDDETSDNSEDSSLMKLMKEVQNQLLNYKGTSLDDKTEHLKKLRNNMLHEIKYEISQLSQPKKPESRLYSGYSSEFHMEYPSNEGALMTIGFLTFAVFLIKLVLKLIYTWKLKQQQYYYQMTTTTPASIFLRNRRKDQLMNDSVKIMQYLEEFSPTQRP